jgi:hypothetical protein
MLAFVLALAAGVADAKSCKDPKTGKVIKCPPTAARPQTLVFPPERVVISAPKNH